ncbi:hypothetical protein IPL68_04405 [Candidatus Saccharibacteria bacterium]|nr:MAG: hypothetical protein IPL68_04405 [Candidatus Saccharibacteria bacterium]
MEENSWYRYIVLLDGIKSNEGLLAPPERIAYAFHTFSLHDENVYEPTGDVTFMSPNPDTKVLESSIERMIDAVLHLTVKARVMRVEDVLALLMSAQDELLEIGGFTRSINDLKATLRISG